MKPSLWPWLKRLFTLLEIPAPDAPRLLRRIGGNRANVHHLHIHLSRGCKFRSLLDRACSPDFKYRIVQGFWDPGNRDLSTLHS